MKPHPTFLTDGVTDHTVRVGQRLPHSFHHLSVRCVRPLCQFLLQVFSTSTGPLQQFLIQQTELTLIRNTENDDEVRHLVIKA